MTDPPTGTPDTEFSRNGVDPTSRCLRCGASVAYDGRQQHVDWHRGFSELVAQLMISFGG